MALFDPKTKKIAEYQKEIETLYGNISRNYDRIGRLYYGQYKDMNIDSTKEINACCEAITKWNEDIASLEVKILFEKGLKRCPSCGKENNLEYAFCFACGAKFADADVATKTVSEDVETEEIKADVSDKTEDVSASTDNQ